MMLIQLPGCRNSAASPGNQRGITPSGSCCFAVMVFFDGCGTRLPFSFLTCCPCRPYFSGTSSPVFSSLTHIETSFSCVSGSSLVTSSVLDFGLRSGSKGTVIDRTAAEAERDAAPDQDHHGHDRRGDHDLQGLAAGLMDADDVLAEEIKRDRNRNEDRPPIGETDLGGAAALKKSLYW